MISVIVSARNARDHIGACLRALLQQTDVDDEYEIIVVDDGSTDDTGDVARRLGVRVIVQPHRGPAAARNHGANTAKGSLLLFTDADCEPARNWISKMIRPFDQLEIVGAKGAYKSRQRDFVARFVQLEFEDKYDLLRKSKYIDFVDTYSAGYRREIFLSNGGFDESIPEPSVEDVDFSFRLAERGHKMVFVPDAIVYHHHPDTLLRYLRRKFRFGYWRTLIYRRYPGKAFSDSRTPMSLRVQVVLTGLLFPATAFSFVTTWLLPAATICLLLISTMPFAAKAALKDPAIGLTSPILILARALAIAAGLLVGAIRRINNKGRT